MSGGARSLLVRFGGHSRAELLTMLSDAGVRLNAHAETLLADMDVDGQPERSMRFTGRRLEDLGLPEGAPLSEVFAAGRRHGLHVVPLLAAPYMRLALDGQESAPDSVLSQGRAPTGSIHIASKPVSEDVAYPKGFYLRGVDGQPWLRGYRCDDSYVFGPEQEFLFAGA